MLRERESQAAPGAKGPPSPHYSPSPPPLSGALAIHQPVALKISLLNESLI